MISIQVTDNAAQILAKLQNFPQAMATSVAKALDQENELTVGQIQIRKLSHKGPMTLGVVSARLWKSIVRTCAFVAGGAIISAIGSNVVYAGVHEFGFDGNVSVRAYVRRRLAPVSAASRVDFNMITGRITRRLIKPKPREQLGLISVRAHTMHMHFPERAPIRSTIEERRADYCASVSQAIVNTWNGRN
jgi:phage gpG-like protein